MSQVSRDPIGPLSAIYSHRLYSVADGLRDGCERLFAATPPPSKAGEGYIRVDPPLMAVIEGVLLAGANIRKLLHPPKERGKKESAAAYRIRQLRTKALAELVGGIDTTEIRNTQARNALEHLDEKLDEMNAQLVAGSKRLGSAVPFNLILSHGRLLDQFNIGLQYPLAVYDAGARIFRIMTYEVNLGRLHTEAAAIADRVRPIVVSRSDERGPGGMIIVLPPENRETPRAAG